MRLEEGDGVFSEMIMQLVDAYSVQLFVDAHLVQITSECELSRFQALIVVEQLSFPKSSWTRDNEPVNAENGLSREPLLGLLFDDHLATVVDKLLSPALKRFKGQMTLQGQGHCRRRRECPRWGPLGARGIPCRPRATCVVAFGSSEATKTRAPTRENDRRLVAHLDLLFLTNAADARHKRFILWESIYSNKNRKYL